MLHEKIILDINLSVNLSGYVFCWGVKFVLRVHHPQTLELSSYFASAGEKCIFWCKSLLLEVELANFFILLVVHKFFLKSY